MFMCSRLFLAGYMLDKGFFPLSAISSTLTFPEDESLIKKVSLILF